MKEAIEIFTNWRRFKVKGATVAAYQQSLRQFCLFVRNPEIEDITIDHVMQYLNGMADLGWEMNSLMPKTMALRKFFEFFRRRGSRVIDEELIPVPSKQFSLPRIADEERYRALIGSIPFASNDPRHVRNAALIRMYWDTGARNSEALSLDVDDLDLNGRRAIIRTAKSKGRRPFREIFWTGETNDRLLRWLDCRSRLSGMRAFPDSTAVFVSINNWNYGYRLTKKAVGELLRRQSERAGISYLNAHSMRHRKGHHIIKSGGSSADVMNVLGHATLESTKVYTMMTGQELEGRARHFLDETRTL